MTHVFRPKIKPTVQVFRGTHNVYFRTCGYVIDVDDGTGIVSSLCDRMDGSRSIQCLANELKTDANIIHDIISALDDSYLIEDAAKEPPQTLDTYDIARWHRNFEFFNALSHSPQNKYEFQLILKKSRIALLGLGGLGSHILYDLAALGICDIMAVDFDMVELSNLNRQILYGESNIGHTKTEAAKIRIKQFSNKLHIETLNKKLSSSYDIETIIEDRDAVICVADKPKTKIVGWLNEACVKCRVPFINGGLDTSRALYYTVIPEQSGCVECWRRVVQSRDEVSTFMLAEERRQEGRDEPPAPAIVPLVSILTGFIVAELIRLITKITPPIATNRLMAVDFVGMRVTEAETWARDSNCYLCGTKYIKASGGGYQPNRSSAELQA